jgi:hypothetical protein
MNREFDVFECVPGGSVMWRGTVLGLMQARITLHKLAKKTNNECFAICIPTGELVFRADASRSDGEIAKRIFQISYSEQLMLERAEILRSHGFGVMSAFGNEAAKVILSRLPNNGGQISLFVIGHAASEETRLDMVHWLGAKFPDAKVLALNPPECQRLDELKYNARYDSPEAWLPLAAMAAG